MSACPLVYVHCACEPHRYRDAVLRRQIRVFSDFPDEGHRQAVYYPVRIEHLDHLRRQTGKEIIQDNNSRPNTKMRKVHVIYAPDAKSSGSLGRPISTQSNHQRPMQARIGAAEEYLNILKPKKGPSRLEFHPDLPKTLTPKGYAKLKLMMGVAAKQYDNLVRRLQREGRLWEDPDFPASDASIGDPKLNGRVEWKRPKELNPNAQFFVGGASRFDIEQGELGDCWLLAVVSSISSYLPLFDHIIPKEQNLQGPKYVGVFRVRFWRFGQWIEVLVDDRLPVYRGTKRLVFMHSADESEFWSALLEKAYAKLNGCYAHLSGGSQGEAMEDLTGGVVETIELSPGKRPADLLEQMIVYSNRCCLMGCAADSETIEARLSNGLIGGHAYSVTAVQPVNCAGRKQYLVRCRNPWGGHYEWTGAWSDKSSDWNKVNPQQKELLGLQFRDDGEFWMSFEDFVSCFSRLEVCHLGLESLEHDQEFHGKQRLEESILNGCWEKGVSAGGCINNRATFATNPQFRFTVTDPDPKDNENKCFVIIALMQKDVRAKGGADFLTIGFMLYQVENNQKNLITRTQLLTKRAVGKSAFSNSREVSGHFRLEPGTYVVVPSTFHTGEEAHFILRILSQVAVTDQELDDENRQCECVMPLTLHAQPNKNQMQSLPYPEKDMQPLRSATVSSSMRQAKTDKENEEIELKFNQLADRQTRAIGAQKLAKLLNESSLKCTRGFTGFNKELCRSMVASVDQNLTGLVELAEFMELWSKLKIWRAIFEKHDTDNTGSFKAQEFREALKDAGFTVSNKLFHALVHRYEDFDTQSMSFEDFLLCTMRLKNVFETASAQAKTPDGYNMFTMEDYLRFGVYI